MKVTIVLGEDAVSYCEDNAPLFINEEWVKNHRRQISDRGAIVTRDFKSSDQVEAYMQGVEDATGYLESIRIVHDEYREITKKFVNLIHKYGKHDELFIFDICSDYGLEIGGSTIDNISIVGTTVWFYYNQNIGEMDDIRNFSVNDLKKFAKSLEKYIKERIEEEE